MKIMKIMPIAALLMTGIFHLPAFAAPTRQPLAPGELAVKIIPDTNVEIVQTTARQDGENVIVDGYIQRKKVHGRMIPTGHVDITIIDEQGKTVDKTFTRVAPEILPRIDGVKSTFMTQLPVRAPKGSLVSIKFHSGSHES